MTIKIGLHIYILIYVYAIHAYLQIANNLFYDYYERECMYTYLHINIHIYIHKCALSTALHTHIHIQTHTHIHIQTSIHTHMLQNTACHIFILVNLHQPDRYIWPFWPHLFDHLVWPGAGTGHTASVEVRAWFYNNVCVRVCVCASWCIYIYKHVCVCVCPLIYRLTGISVSMCVHVCVSWCS